MKRFLIGAVALAIAAVAPTFAHHSFAMFDMEKETVFTGTVVEYNWENPHTHIIIKVAPGAKNPETVGTWDIEAAAINIMARQGWTRNTLKPGDHVTLVAHPMRDGTKGASLYYAITPDGKRLYMDIKRPGATSDSPPSGNY